MLINVQWFSKCGVGLTGDTWDLSSGTGFSLIQRQSVTVLVLLCYGLESDV